MSWIPKVSPHLDAPEHLKPIVDVFEKIRQGNAGLRVVIHAPPQHGKTFIIIHALNWLMMASPGNDHAYASYSHTRSLRISNQCRDISRSAGIHATGTQEYWGDGQSRMLWTSCGGALTGYPITKGGVLIVDDPVKDRREAESPTVQATQRDWIDDIADSRCHPGASIIVCQTRWCEGDLAGHCIRQGYEYICLPALDDNDRPLWPEVRPYALLDAKRRRNAYTWASRYQGQPRPRGKSVFGPSTEYAELPKTARRVGFGLDLAYTAKTSSDFSVLIKGVKVGDTLYIVDMWREQVEIKDFKGVMRDATKVGSHILWYIGGQEKAVASLIRPDLKGRKLIVKPASTDKLTRALAASEAWNLGHIQVPEEAPWLEDFISEVSGFTGVKDMHDDIVDALGALWDLLDMPSNTYSKEFQRAAAKLPKARFS